MCLADFAGHSDHPSLIWNCGVWTIQETKHLQDPPKYYVSQFLVCSTRPFHFSRCTISISPVDSTLRRKTARIKNKTKPTLIIFYSCTRTESIEGGTSGLQTHPASAENRHLPFLKIGSRCSGVDGYITNELYSNSCGVFLSRTFLPNTWYVMLEPLGTGELFIFPLEPVGGCEKKFLSSVIMAIWVGPTLPPGLAVGNWKISYPRNCIFCFCSLHQLQVGKSDNS